MQYVLRMSEGVRRIMYSMRFETEELRGGANGGYAEKRWTGVVRVGCKITIAMLKGGEGRGGDQGVE